MTNTATTVYLDEQFRTPGVDHLEHYRSSCFFNLVSKSIKERGNAYEQIAAKVLSANGVSTSVSPASSGSWDLMVDGEKVELKASRVASPYDSRGRTYQFTAIRRIDGPIYLMTLDPDDTVSIYKTTFENISKHAGKTYTDNEDILNLSKTPEQIGATHIVTQQMA